MPIENKIRLLPLEEITVPEDRLRFNLDKDHVNELATAFRTEDLINPIVVDRDTHRLVAGAHRYGAYELNQLLKIEPAAKWDKIPVRFCYNVTPQELLALELSENIRARRMDWKEIALGVQRVHAFTEQTDDEEVAAKATATVLSMGIQTVYQNLRAAKYLDAKHELVLAATSLKGALNVIERIQEREFDELREHIVSGVLGGTPVPEPTDDWAEPADKDKAPRQPGDTSPTEFRPSAPTFHATGSAGFSVCQGDFIDFARAYSGPRFNLIHCDFPYGIDYDKSGFEYAKQHSIYGDSKDLYFALLSALCENTPSLVADSAHLIFWYNTRYQAETIDLLSRAGWKVWPHHLIWHKSDNAGVLADFKRGPRHTHETALFASRGDRKLVKPVADSYSGPTTRDSGHVSEKPVAMLTHFLTMAVDETTCILDPTAGSCNSMLAAKSLGAKMGIAVECDKDYAARGARILAPKDGGE
jgi:DNA modification methylase